MTIEFLIGLLRANLAGGVAILVVLLLRRPVRRAFGARVAYALWALAPLAAVASLLPQPAAGTLVSPVVLEAASVVRGAVPRALAAEATAPALLLLWLAGAVAAAGLLARRQARFMASLGRLHPASAGSGVLRAEQAGIGPAVVGALRPRIVTPADFEARFAPQERAVILAHEQVHLDVGDARINAAAAFVQCVSWFNPLAHLGARALRIDQELACDAAVVGRFPEARRLYAEVLLKTQLATQALPLGCHWPAGAEHPLKERIIMLKSPLPTPSRRAAGVALVAALSLGGACAAWAAQTPPSEIVQPDWVQTPTSESLIRYYPPDAVKAGVGARVVLRCGVDEVGRLEDCKVLSEAQVSPSGEVQPSQYPFGAAALKLSESFQMRPMSRDGAPTGGGVVRIPIMFRLP